MVEQPFQIRTQDLADASKIRACSSLSSPGILGNCAERTWVPGKVEENCSLSGALRKWVRGARAGNLNAAANGVPARAPHPQPLPTAQNMFHNVTMQSDVSASNDKTPLRAANDRSERQSRWSWKHPMTTLLPNHSSNRHPSRAPRTSFPSRIREFRSSTLRDAGIRNSCAPFQNHEPPRKWHRLRSQTGVD